MILKRIINILLLATAITQVGKAQVPLNDPAWILQNGSGSTLNLSDEFDATYVDSVNRWLRNYGNYVLPNVGMANGAELDYTKNLISTGNGSGNGTLIIRADSLTPPNQIYISDTSKILKYGFNQKTNQPPHGLTFAYTGGVITSKSNSFKYGYLEINAKYPSKKWSAWPCFWLFHCACDTNVGPPYFLNEIDITERTGPQSATANTVLNNDWCGGDTCGNRYNISIPETLTIGADSLDGAFHKYALEWDPNHLIYYFDDVPVTTIIDYTGLSIQQNGLYLIINQCVDPWTAWLPSDWDGKAFQNTAANHGNHSPTKWPRDFEVDYFRYYKLGTNCSTALSPNLCTPAGYDRKVRKSITTDNTCTPTFNQSTALASYTLRATDFVLLDVGTTVDPTGMGYFAIEINPCPL